MSSNLTKISSCPDYRLKEVGSYTACLGLILLSGWFFLALNHHHWLLITAVVLVGLLAPMFWVAHSGLHLHSELRIQQGRLEAMRVEAQSMEERLTTDHLKGFGATLDSIGEAVVYTDQKGCIVDLNRMAILLGRCSRSTAVGRPAGEVFPLMEVGTGNSTESPLLRSLRTGEVTQRATVQLPVPGQAAPLIVSSSCAPIRDSSAEIIGAFLIFRDTTEEIQVREAASERERALQTIFDACPFPMAIQRLEDGAYRMVNPAFEQVVHLSADELIGHPPVEPEPSNGLFPYAEMQEKLLQQGFLDDVPVSSLGPDGRERHGMAAARIIEHQGATCSLCIVVDITEYRSLQEALAHTQR